MKHYPKCACGRKRLRFAESQLDLFLDSAPPALPALIPTTYAERTLMKWPAMPLHMARLYAELASLGGRA